MTDLSPAARAVLNVFVSNAGEGHRHQSAAVAAALRAAADLVAPDDYKCFTGNLEWDAGMEARTDAIREDLLAIAAQLKNAQ